MVSPKQESLPKSIFGLSLELTQKQVKTPRFLPRRVGFSLNSVAESGPAVWHFRYGFGLF